jgi:hypothetical protein
MRRVTPRSPWIDRWPRWVLTLLAAVCCLGAPACSSEDDPVIVEPTPDDPVTSELELRDGMRGLWMDHVTWTRVYLISAIADLPDADAAAGRLLQNQVDIGNAIKPFYDEAAGAALTELLQEHITIAVEIVDAAKAGDAPALEDAKTRWYANADAIAAFLAAANPNWPLADLQAMMSMHLDQTLAEATARLTGDWVGDVAAYDEIVDHIVVMADALGGGIAQQFPGKVASSEAMSGRDQDLHRGMRELWIDHVTWTRVYLIAAIADLPDADAAASRLLQNQVDIGNAIKPFYGDAGGEALTALLQEHITIAVEIVRAAKEGDTSDFDEAKERWYDNADEIAAFLAGANPNWPLADLQAMMKMHLDQTLAEATARLTGDWAGDVETYDEIVSHILVMADALSAGIAVQFPGDASTTP